ncbi:MAG TPA: lipoprotein [Burkholderiales bacterium]|nr:lipoprotein [Burkholderiales bacterium]
MKRLLSALALALALAGCQVEPGTTPGTILSVQEAPQALPEDLLRFDDDHLALPEVAWEVEVQLDDGSQVTAIHAGARRYMPGERVRLLIDADGALLL